MLLMLLVLLKNSASSLMRNLKLFPLGGVGLPLYWDILNRKSFGHPLEAGVKHPRSLKSIRRRMGKFVQSCFRLSVAGKSWSIPSFVFLQNPENTASVGRLLKQVTPQAYEVEVATSSPNKGQDRGLHRQPREDEPAPRPRRGPRHWGPRSRAASRPRPTWWSRDQGPGRRPRKRRNWASRRSTRTPGSRWSMTPRRGRRLAMAEAQHPKGRPEDLWPLFAPLEGA